MSWRQSLGRGTNCFLENQNRRNSIRSKLLQRCLCDKSGRQLFTPEEIDKLSAKSVKVMSKLFDAAMKHNAVTEKDVEDLAKN